MWITSASLANSDHTTEFGFVTNEHRADALYAAYEAVSTYRTEVCRDFEDVQVTATESWLDDGEGRILVDTDGRYGFLHVRVFRPEPGRWYDWAAH